MEIKNLNGKTTATKYRSTTIWIIPVKVRNVSIESFLRELLKIMSKIKIDLLIIIF